MTEARYDVVVIGGGPGGYVAALRASQLGMRVACVDRRGALGGTCLHVGCIPSKALLHASERYAETRHSLPDLGIVCGSVELDLPVMMERKRRIVDDLAKGISFLCEKNKVEHVTGTATIPRQKEVLVAIGEDEQRSLHAEHIVIATGSEPMPLPGVEIDEEYVLSSTGALALSSVPERMVVIGAGAIGLELGSVWSRLGAEVIIVELLDRILPGMDGEIAQQTQRILERQGLQFRLGCKVASARARDGGVALALEQGENGESLTCTRALVAVGRRPHVAGLGLEELGVRLDRRGFVQVNERFETAVSGIFAIGDCIPGPMLAHKAEDEGIVCAEMLAGQSGSIDHDRVPSVVYTWPEVAGVGSTEEALKDESRDYAVGRFPFSANSRARITGDSEGLVKILTDAASDRVLGVHLVGPMAGDLIAEAVVAMEFGASAEDVARTCHAHPANAEAIREAALSVAGRALHK